MPSIINATTSTGLVTTADNSGSLQLATNNGTTAVTIDTSQRVGVNATDPGTFSSGVAQAVIERTSAGNNTVPLALVNRSGVDNTSVSLDFNPNTNIALAQIRAFRTNAGFGGATDLRFLNYDGSALAERMRIDSSGNVGVGATSLAATFTVNSVSQGNGNQGIINRIRNNHYVGYASRDISTNTNIFQLGPFPANNVGGGGAIVRIVVGGVKGGNDFFGSVYEFMVVKSGQTALTINTVHNYGATGVTSTVSGNYAVFGLNFTNYSSASMTFEVLCGAAQNAVAESIVTPTFV